uniref:Uncharacterized protein n=1 Tax=Mycobacterium riyadhense TaxID=486698 RepID=A0A653F1Q5_9MYCO|nr:hypothetical protein BIN_B_05130 [Mycobacterium riyadhense]
MSTLPPWISNSTNNFDVVAPIKARACDALYAVLRNRRYQVADGPRLMRRGAERC